LQTSTLDSSFFSTVSSRIKVNVIKSNIKQKLDQHHHYDKEMKLKLRKLTAAKLYSIKTSARLHYDKNNQRYK
jgi:hypothetical protein